MRPFEILHISAVRNNKMKRVIQCLFVAVFFLTACNPFDEPRGSVILSVGEKKVTPDEFKQDLTRIISGMGLTTRDISPSLKLLVDKVINYYLIMEYCEDKGITVGPNEVESAIEDMKKDYDEDLFQEILLEKYIDYEDWKKGVAHQLLMKKVMTRIGEDLDPVTVSEIERYYENHREEFFQSQMIRFKQIVTQTREKALNYKKRIKEGETIEELIEGSNMVPGVLFVGTVEWIAANNLEETLEKAVSSIKLGKISPIIQTPYGFHIMKVTGRRPEGLRRLPEVRNEIEARILQRRKETFFQDWLNNLRNDYRVEVNEDLLSKMEFE
jgi:hypothetical protein